jgi:hypothetical protein
MIGLMDVSLLLELLDAVGPAQTAGHSVRLRRSRTGRVRRIPYGPLLPDGCDGQSREPMLEAYTTLGYVAARTSGCGWGYL